MEPLDWQDVVAQQADVFAWLRTAGLDKRNRFRIHQEHIEEMLHAEAVGGIYAYNERLTTEEKRGRLWSLCESWEFVDALSVLRRLDPPGLLGVVAAALDGPADLYLENDRCNVGRNRMFEITLAATFARAGISIEFGEHPDIVAEFEGRKILVECKRPLGLTGLWYNLRKAGRQLREDVKLVEHRQACTVVSICCSRALNPGDRLLVCDTEEAVRPMLDRWVEREMDTLMHLTQQISRYRIGAVHFYVSTPVHVTSLRKTTIGRSALLAPLAASKADYELLRRLSEELLI